MRTGSSSKAIWAARIIAVAADVIQWLVAPTLMVPGLGLAVEDAVDVAVAATMVWLLGWHWAFLPTVVAEAVPLMNLVPSWTAAVLLVTRKAPEAPTKEVAAGG